MTILFQTKPGSVVSMPDPAVQCTARLLGVDPQNSGAGIDFRLQRSILTRMTVSQQVNVQFLHTLGAQIYIYVFGDRIGQMTLSGLSFSCGCDDDAIVGAEQMLLWYRVNRSSRRKQPVQITIGKTVIQGFVTGLTEDVVDASLNLVQWGVNLATLPDDS